MESAMKNALAESSSVSIRIGNYSVRLTNREEEVLEAQRLRYKVFVEEFGARLSSTLQDHDVDQFDKFCEHLIVRDEESGRVVGTYRILSPRAAREVGSYYSETEFNLTRLDHLRNQMVEVGRSCIHVNYRSGTVIALLWSGLSSYMISHGYEYLIGCASISMADGGHNAANIFSQLDPAVMAPKEYNVFPKHRLPYEHLANGQAAVVPPLIKGYLRAGAWICGEPAWDPDFNSADLPILLPLSRINRRYSRHFVKGAVA